jgi:hypothetical protein
MISTPPAEPRAMTGIDEDRLAWLALALSPALGPKRILDAMQQLKIPSRLFALSLTDLEGLRFPAETAQFIFDGKARHAAEEEWERVAGQGAYIVSHGCPEYPERLREIYDPPPVLWVRGDANLLARPCEPAGAAIDCDCGNAAPFALRDSGGGDVGARPVGAAAAGGQWDGAGYRYLCA